MTSGGWPPGQSLLDPALTERVLERLRDQSDEDPLLASLTPQERRILDLVAEGQTNRQIAGTLFLAEKTVKNYVSNLLAKLGMERRTQAATYATRVAERSAHDAAPTPPAPDPDRVGYLFSAARDSTCCSILLRSSWGRPKRSASQLRPRLRA